MQLYVYLYTSRVTVNTGFEPGFPASLTNPITTTLILPVEIIAVKDCAE